MKIKRDKSRPRITNMNQGSIQQTLITWKIQVGGTLASNVCQNMENKTSIFWVLEKTCKYIKK